MVIASDALVLHEVEEAADPLDGDLALVAVAHDELGCAGPANAGGRAGDDDIAGAQRQHLAQRLDQRCHAKHHVGRGARLHGVAVEPGLDLQAMRSRRQFVGRHDDRSKAACGVEILAQSPLRAFGLVLAYRPVVEDRIAEHMVKCVLAADVPASLADDHCQFRFVVERVGALRPDDWVAMAAQAGAVTGKDRREIRHCQACLLRMVGVVQANAIEAGRIHDWGEIAHHSAIDTVPGGAHRFAEMAKGNSVLEQGTDVIA